MQLGFVGLGKMGFNMRERLREGGHEVIGYDPRPEVTGRADARRPRRGAGRAPGGVGDGAVRTRSPTRPIIALAEVLSRRATW